VLSAVPHFTDSLQPIPFYTLAVPQPFKKLYFFNGIWKCISIQPSLPLSYYLNHLNPDPLRPYFCKMKSNPIYSYQHPGIFPPVFPTYNMNTAPPLPMRVRSPPIPSSSSGSLSYNSFTDSSKASSPHSAI
jgi:hypothetical protein